VFSPLAGAGRVALALYKVGHPWAHTTHSLRLPPGHLRKGCSERKTWPATIHASNFGVACTVHAATQQHSGRQHHCCHRFCACKPCRSWPQPFTICTLKRSRTWDVEIFMLKPTTPCHCPGVVAGPVIHPCWLPSPTHSVRAEAGNGSSQYDYDMITIGAGSGGVRASRFATSYGKRRCWQPQPSCAALLNGQACHVRSVRSPSAQLTSNSHTRPL
jgi:hypothetical protein